MSTHTITIDTAEIWGVKRGQGCDVYATGACSCGESVGSSVSKSAPGPVGGRARCSGCGATCTWSTNTYRALANGEGRPAITITGD